ncbi:hypothetical protein Amsp01_088210 [Amycolatopsis sp. NBRC 101858]|uniref:hypothetical protein n=1 Tax=Amycolatopsis sp. NBRC 101858 TaxID=3032200 RepID=UPI0024A1F0CE|nr:hypothetical protein [Amycolatopsis sp. NBRC 101858]GLY42798.1 hypothetical protein Amsp01_088210 [Amycolatopsis sp. NBRC 101858]
MKARQVAAAHAVWGGALVATSRSVFREQREMAAVGTALGVRHVVQAAVTLAKPESTRWMWIIDAAHGVSMLGLTAVAPRWRTFALTGAASAATWAFAARKAR